MRVESSDSEPIRMWVLEHLDYITGLADSFPEDHDGFVAGLHDVQSRERREALEPLQFPYTHLENINRQLMDDYGIPENSEYARMGWIVGYAGEGYKCRVHRDVGGGRAGFFSTRLNVLISKPEEGGDPIMFIDGKEVIIEVEENLPWLCVAGQYDHSTTKTQGPTPRILLSFGYDLEAGIIEELDYMCRMKAMLTSEV